MRFSVTWSTEATNRLMALWLARPFAERAAFSERVDSLEDRIVKVMEIILVERKPQSQADEQT